MTKIKAMYTFANVGISNWGLDNLDVVCANELLPKRADLYKKLYPDCDVICADITKEETKELLIKKYQDYGCELLIQTPPCQGHSTSNVSKNKKEDPRNQLICDAIELVRRIKPMYLLFENVPAFLKDSVNVEGKMLNIKEYVESELKSLGYYVTIAVLDAADYGTPQHRNRAFILASLNGQWTIPEKQKQITLREAIGDLPSIEAGQYSGIYGHYCKKSDNPSTLHNIECLKHTPTGCSPFLNEDVRYRPVTKTTGSWLKTRMKRAEFDRPAGTLLCSSKGLNNQNSVHPGRLKVLPDGNVIYTDARIYTPLEVFRICGLPDDFPILKYASEDLTRTVLGEAFLPKMLQALLTTIPTKGEKNDD